jgi:hypothetical protein
MKNLDTNIDISSLYSGNTSTTKASMPRFGPLGNQDALNYLKAILAAERQQKKRPVTGGSGGAGMPRIPQVAPADRGAGARSGGTGGGTPRWNAWGGSIPMRPADQFGPAVIDWERVASLGPDAMAKIKASSPDFLQ